MKKKVWGFVMDVKGLKINLYKYFEKVKNRVRVRKETG
jgi:hypothetical protein